MSRRFAKKRSTRERVLDIVKEALLWIVVTGLAFIYWMAVLLILSLVLLNVWHVRFEAILRYAVILTVITSLAYLGRKIYQYFH